MNKLTANEVLMIQLETISECDCRIAVTDDAQEKELNERIKVFATHDLAVIKRTFDQMGIEYDKKLSIEEV